MNRAFLMAASLIILGLLALLYGFSGNNQETAVHGHSAILWMVKRWSGAGGDLSHAWLIPLISAFVIWSKRKELAAAEKRVNSAGLIIIVMSLLLHWVGMRTQLTRLSLLSLLGLLWGMPLYFMGWQVARMLIFPCSYLLFCIPLSFLNNLTVPLRIMASAISTGILNGFGIAAIRRGTMIRSLDAGGFNLDVADPCSGLSSLLAMTALAAAYAYFTQKGLVRKWALFLSAVPVAMAGNVVRIVTIAIVAKYFGQEHALKVYHSMSGFLVFLVATLLMITLGQLLKKTEFVNNDIQTKGSEDNEAEIA